MTRDEALHVLQMMQREFRLPEHKVDALEMAIKSLEKQFPKKPIFEGGFIGVYKCPVCKTIVGPLSRFSTS